jgi:hypothetical protein
MSAQSPNGKLTASFGIQRVDERLGLLTGQLAHPGK